MAITLGMAQLNADGTVTITSPVGQFGGVDAVRLTNYTGDALVITNINENRPGQEYLMPFQQMVYQQVNVRNPPSVESIALGGDFDTSTLLVEWSSEALADFPGTYPQNLTMASVGLVAAPFFAVHELNVPDDSTTHSIPANPKRTSITIYNDGGSGGVPGTPNPCWWSAHDSWPRPLLEAGGARTLATAQTILFRGAGLGDTSIQYFETFYGASDIT